MLPSAPKYVSIVFTDKCLHIINNKVRLNELKGSTKIQKKRITIQILITFLQCSKEQ